MKMIFYQKLFHFEYPWHTPTFFFVHDHIWTFKSASELYGNTMCLHTDIQYPRILIQIKWAFQEKGIDFFKLTPWISSQFYYNPGNLETHVFPQILA